MDVTEPDRNDRLRVEAEALAADPNDVAEMRRVRADMEPARALLMR